MGSFMGRFKGAFLGAAGLWLGACGSWALGEAPCATEVAAIDRDSGGIEDSGGIGSETWQAVAAGGLHSCAIDGAGGLICVGHEADGRLEAPQGVWEVVDLGLAFGCAFGETELSCWGRGDSGQLLVPEELRVQGLSVGAAHACGWDATGEATCWGRSLEGQTGALPGDIGLVAAGWLTTCWLDVEGTPGCVGDDRQGIVSDLPLDRLSRLALGQSFGVGIDLGGGFACWGKGLACEEGALSGPFVEVAAGMDFACALGEDGSVACLPEDGPSLEGDFVAINADSSGLHVCGLDRSGAIQCAGSDAAGQVSGFGSQSP